MNTLSHLKFRVRCWIEDRLPERRQRFRAAGMLFAVGACAVWIGVFAVGAAAGGPGGAGGGTSRPTPQIRHAQELEAALHKEAAFAGVTILPHLDYPGRLRVSGQVNDAAALKRRLAELDPGAVWMVEVR